MRCDNGEPVKITARLLLTPLANFAPQIDGVMDSTLRHRLMHVRGMEHPPIPIVRREVAGQSIACCSNPILGPIRDDRAVRFGKRFPVDKAHLLAPEERTVISTSTGEYRSYWMPVRAILVESVAWFAVAMPGKRYNSNRQRWIVSSAARECRNLLKDVTAIGGEVNVGWGRVAEWTVEPWHADWSWFAPTRDGRRVLMRTLPDDGPLPDDVVGAKRSFGAARGPYFDPANFQDVVMPC